MEVCEVNLARKDKTATHLSFNDELLTREFFVNIFNFKVFAATILLQFQITFESIFDIVLVNTF